MKKKGGTAAGVPRSTGEAQSVAVSNGAPRDQVCDTDFIFSVFVDEKTPLLAIRYCTPVFNSGHGNQSS
jgi:hypothetical protein